MAVASYASLQSLALANAGRSFQFPMSTLTTDGVMVAKDDFVQAVTVDPGNGEVLFFRSVLWLASFAFRSNDGGQLVSVFDVSLADLDAVGPNIQIIISPQEMESPEGLEIDHANILFVKDDASMSKGGRNLRVLIGRDHLISYLGDDTGGDGGLDGWGYRAGTSKVGRPTSGSMQRHV